VSAQCCPFDRIHASNIKFVVGRQRENCFGTDDSDASYFDFNKIPNNIEIDDLELSENDCVVNKSFNVLNNIIF
jgi:hypothetical protein